MEQKRRISNIGIIAEASHFNANVNAIIKEISRKQDDDVPRVEETDQDADSIRELLAQGLSDIGPCSDLNNYYKPICITVLNYLSLIHLIQLYHESFLVLSS